MDWFFVLTCHWKEVLTLLVHVLLNETFHWEEAAAWRLSLRLSLKISSNLQENNSVGVAFSQRCRPACKRDSHEDFSCEFSEIFWKKTPFLQNTSEHLQWPHLNVSKKYYEGLQENKTFSTKLDFLSIEIRCIFRALSNIFCGVFLRKS